MICGIYEYRFMDAALCGQGRQEMGICMEVCMEILIEIMEMVIEMIGLFWEESRK